MLAPSLFLTMAYFAACALYFVLLLIVFFKIRFPVYRAYSVFLWGLFLWTLTLYIYLYQSSLDWLLFFGRFNFAAGVFIAWGLAAFFYLFPQKSPSFPKWIEWSYILFSIVLFFLSLFTPLIDQNEVMTDHGPEMTTGILHPIYSFYLAVSVLFSAIIGFRKSFILTGLEKIKFHYSFFIFVPTCALAYFLSIVLPMFDITAQFSYMFLSTIPIALSSFYAIHQYRFFHFSFFTLRILRLFVLFIAFFFTLLFVYLLCLSFLSSSHELLKITLSAFSGLLGFYYASRFFPPLATSSVREFKNALQTLSSCTSCGSYPELQSALDSIFVLKLNIASAKIYVVRKNRTPLDYIPCYEKGDFTHALENQGLLVLDELRLRKGNENIIQAMEELGAYLCLPLFAEKNLVGFFVLGKKGDLYAREEIEEIVKILPHMEIVLMNILLNLNLQEENDMMKAIIEKKTQALKKQYVKVNELLRQQGDLIAMTAHEFRTPLSIALFQLEDIVDAQKENPEVLEDLQVLESSLQNLKNLMQRLFDVQQYDLKKVVLQKTEADIGLFVEKIYREFQAPMREEELSFSFENTLREKCIVHIDRSRMHQVLYNLLGNAMKFVTPKGKISLMISPEKKGVFISVFNEGRHISDREKKHIFEKFCTKDSAPLTGIGLGLYVCQKTLELHKGDIWVENVLGGVHFHVFLPQ